MATETLDVDALIKARPICKALGGISRRTLFEWIRRGKFPRPDVPASSRGAPDLWRESTLKKAFADLGMAQKCGAARV